MRELKIIKIIKRPISNKRGAGIIDAIVYPLAMVIGVSLILYVSTYVLQMSITNKVDSIAGSMLDAISENRELNSAMQQHYKKDIDKLSFYMGNYTIKYRKVNFQTGTITDLATSNNGAATTNLKFNKGDIIRIEIASTSDTTLTKLSKFFHSNAKAGIVGYSEGGID